jgi:hypothetical protein
MPTITNRWSREVRSPVLLLSRDLDVQARTNAPASGELMRMAMTALKELAVLRTQVFDAAWEDVQRFEFMPATSSRSIRVRFERGSEGAFLPHQVEDD